jgi:hypothetical protein
LAQVKLLKGDRQKGETRKAVLACNDFLRLGAGRSVPMLFQRYAEISTDTPPTRSKNTLRVWHLKFDWSNRADEYDAEIEAQKSFQAEARRNEILNTGLALAHERVAALKEVADFLKGEIDEGGDERRPNVWLPDVKQVGGGKDAERVDIERFNGSLLEQFRGTLDDLAKETGGRIRRDEVTGKDGKPIQQEIALDLSKLTVEQLTALAQALKD